MKPLYFLVEGRDDARFVKRIIAPLFAKDYFIADPFEYAQKSRKKIQEFLWSIRKMEAECILFSDLNSSKCVTQRKEKWMEEYKGLASGETVVVIPEIEAWYAGGLAGKACRTLGFTELKSTDKLTKEAFNELKPKRFATRVAFMLEILKHHDFEVCKRKNASFRYFADHFLPAG